MKHMEGGAGLSKPHEGVGPERAAGNPLGNAPAMPAQIIWTCDSNGEGMHLEAWGDYTGQSIESIRLNGWVSAVHPEDQQQAIEDWQMALSERKPYEAALRVRHRSGDYHQSQTRVLPIPNPDGSIREWIGCCTDIHTFSQRETELDHALEMSEQLRVAVVAIGGSPDLDTALTCLVDQTIRVSGMDGGAFYLFGTEEAILRHEKGLAIDFVDKVKRRPLSTAYIGAAITRRHEILNLGQLFPEHDRLGQAFGLRHVYCVALFADQTAFGCLIVFSRQDAPPPAANIERVRILALQTESTFLRLITEQRLRAVSSTMAEGVVVQGADGAITDCNRSAEKILGLTRDQIMGRTSTDPRWKAILENGTPFPGEDHPAMVCLRTGKPCHGVVMGIQLPEGDRRWIQINSEPMVLGGESRPYAAVTSFSDITALKQLEERLRQSHKMESVGRLAGGMAHEFNNLFAAMLLNLELAQLKSENAETRAELAEVVGLTRRGAKLIKQLLAFGQRSILKNERVDLDDVTRQLSPMLRSVLGNGIALELSPFGGPLWVEADPGALEQIILSLCLNGRDAMPDGGRLQLRLTEIHVDHKTQQQHPHSPIGTYACLSVTDNGIGMAEETKKHVFEPFFTTKDVGEGTGLGLAAVHGIVEQLKGWVQFESTLGKSSTFLVFLPVAQRPQPPRSYPASLKTNPSQSMILVVEDDHALRILTRKLLERAGYVVFEAADAREALGIWAERGIEIDLLYTDMVMPGTMNGLGLATRIQREKPQIRVIITSGFNTEQTIPEEAASQGFTYLPKPIEPKVLIATVENSLKTQRSRTQTSE